MFDTPYSYVPIGKDCPPTGTPCEVRLYKFKAKHRDYLVLIENYGFRTVAIKFCDRNLHNSKLAYTKVFNDPENDAFKVIATCITIMRDYWKSNPEINFCFHASFRELLNDAADENRRAQTDIEGYRKVRFTIYKYAMLNYFAPKDFEHSYDKKNCIYLLINKKEAKPKSVKNEVTRFLSKNYEVLFEQL